MTTKGLAVKSLNLTNFMKRREEDWDGMRDSGRAIRGYLTNL